VFVDAFINLPGGRHIKFPQVSMQVDSGAVTVFSIDIAWQPIFDEDGAPLGELWPWLMGGGLYSVIVRFTQSDTQDATNNARDGWIQPGHITMGAQSAAVVFIKDTLADNQIFRAIVTNRGQEKIAEAVAAGQRLVINRAAIDDGNGQSYEPQPNMTSLVNEVWRGDIAAREVEGNTVRLLTVLGANVGPFWCRAIGYFDDEGELIAVASLPASEKVSSMSGVDFKKRILCNITFTDAAALEIVINPVLNTVDHEQMQAALRELTATLNADFAAHNSDENTHAAAFNRHNGESAAHGGHFANTSNPHAVSFAQLVPGSVLPTSLGGTGHASPNIPQFTSDGGAVYGWGTRIGPMMMYRGFAWYLGRNGGARVVGFPEPLQRDHYTTFAQQINLSSPPPGPGASSGPGTAGGATLTTRNRTQNGFELRNNSGSQVDVCNWFVVGLAQ